MSLSNKKNYWGVRIPKSLNLLKRKLTPVSDYVSMAHNAKIQSDCPSDAPWKTHEILLHIISTDLLWYSAHQKTKSY